MSTIQSSANGLRLPAVAGTFYPADPTELTRMIDGYLDRAARLDPEPSILIVPHAGYIFSGHIAARSFRQAIGRGYTSVIILGFNHERAYSFDGAAIWPAGVWRTPLGDVPIDAELADRIFKSSPVFKADRSIHLREHSLEVQVPFLQRALPGVPIVPISIGRPTLENAQRIADGLASILHDQSTYTTQVASHSRESGNPESNDWTPASAGVTSPTANKQPKILIICSTDMSHYPRYADAVRVDRASITALTSLDPLALEAYDEEAMSSGVPELHTTMCGKGPVMVSMMLARSIGAEQVNVIHYANSGDVPEGSRDQVVGYAAIEFIKGRPPALSAEDRSALLKLSRATLHEYLSTRVMPKFESTSAAMNLPRATFVTLRHKHTHELRGCRGEVFARYPLWESVQTVSTLSAVDDPRFPPMSLDELSDMHIEISVLTPLRLARDPNEIVVGQHGIMIRKGSRSGLFLPQVPIEQGWDHDEYLSSLCWMKAGLPADAWRKPGVQLYIFEAEIFEE